ncbi:MAG: Asp-tRNA(Asn)/Glu-tRNA(Gln) amidotransferase subunit GatC [Deltaproteobacteria bacterium]|nr:Asp-tRNA(Asn)/Glu-tRNA(Gln) amidotransferase subunit GatC [Deltaproteobacteria bacterium]
MAQENIDLKTVKQVAALARIEMSDNEMEQYQGQLNAILGYVDKLKELDTTDVPAMAHVSATATPMREDCLREGLGEKVLSNAPQREERFFKVPQVIE